MVMVCRGVENGGNDWLLADDEMNRCMDDLVLGCSLLLGGVLVRWRRCLGSLRKSADFDLLVTKCIYLGRS